MDFLDLVSDPPFVGSVAELDIFEIKSIMRLGFHHGNKLLDITVAWIGVLSHSQVYAWLFL